MPTELKFLGGLFFGFLGFLLLLALLNNDRDKRAFALDLAKQVAATRPHLDRLCQSYFDWSAKYNERVAGMEDQCANYVIKVEKNK